MFKFVMPEATQRRYRKLEQKWIRNERVARARYRQEYPRSGDPWTEAEHRRLNALKRKHVRAGSGERGWLIIAKILGRTPAAVASRWSIYQTIKSTMKRG